MKSNLRQPMDFSVAGPSDEPRALTPAPSDAGDLAIRPPPSLQRLAPVEAESPGIGKAAYLIAVIVGIVWAAALVGFVLGGRDGDNYGVMDTALRGVAEVLAERRAGVDDRAVADARQPSDGCD